MIRKFTALSCVTLLVLLAIPAMAAAGPSIEQVMKNVEGIWKPVKANQPSVQVEGLKKIMDIGDKIVLLDVRTAEEYEAAHLPGAINISRGVIEWKAPKMIKNTDAKIYIYCKSGARGALVTKRLREMGYTNVKNVYTGFKGWVMAGYSVYNSHGEFRLAPEGFGKAEPK
jgi:rhodanese-related sulfurtransferase